MRVRNQVEAVSPEFFVLCMCAEDVFLSSGPLIKERCTMKTLMLGNEAVARGLYEAGCSVVSSYPGTPST